MRRTLGWTFGTAVLLTACSYARSDAPAETAASPASAPALDAPAANTMDAVGEVAQVAGRMAIAAPTAPVAPAAERMIVRNASLTLQVADVRKTLEAISQAALNAKGFIGTSRLWRDGSNDLASVTVRVPADALNATLGAFRGLAVRVENESVSGEDVTRQAVDLRAQLVNLRATEVELRALLTTVRQNARKASEVLEVHAELSRVRGEIERADAELQSLTQLASLSTITIELRPDVVATPIATDSWQPKGVLRDAARALIGTLRVGVNAVIWATVYLLPLALLIAGPAWLLWRALRTRRSPQTA